MFADDAQFYFTIDIVDDTVTALNGLIQDIKD